jgi:hypothetical protein
MIKDRFGNALLEAYDPIDNMLMVKSMQKKFRDSFVTLDSDKWTTKQTGSMTISVANGTLTLATGAIAGDYAEMITKDYFTIPFKVLYGFLLSQRIVNQQFIVEAVSVDESNNLIPCDDLYGCGMRYSNTTAAQAIYHVWNNQLIQLDSAASTIVTTASLALAEIEPFIDETWFHSKAVDSTIGRTNSYVRQQQIPDPSKKYKIRIRAINCNTVPIAVTGAIAGTGNVIRLTVTAHGLSTAQKVWVENIKGVTDGVNMVRGIYTVTTIDANTIELQNTNFTGTYVTGSGRAFPANVNPASTTNFQFQFLTISDYAELTAEITSGRGNAVAGQGIFANDNLMQVNGAAINVTNGTAAGCPRVAIASDNTPFGINPKPVANSGYTIYRKVATADTNAASIKASPGTVSSIYAVNNTASAKYLKLYNKATAPTVGTDTPVFTYLIPANTLVSVPFTQDMGMQFTTGIGIGISGGLADGDTTALAAGDVIAHVTYI